MDLLPWLALAAVTVIFLWVDLHYFARGREPSFREGVRWSIGWLVLLSFAVGDFPMALVFNGFELAAVLLAVMIAIHVANDGESNWFEGLQLLSVYVVLGAVFFYV